MVSATDPAASADVRRYALGRAGQAVFVLWAAFTVSFLILYALPSDPAR